MNLFQQVAGPLAEEQTETLLESPSLRIERIVSTGHASPPGFWYDQPQHEWVAVLQGHAELEFEGQDEPLRMTPGQWIQIPARRRHRVRETAADQPTIWLAVFYEDPASS